MANVKIPYDLTPAVALDIRYANMQSAIARHLPRLERKPIDDTATLSLACYGPSLQETWQALKPPIISMSGATKFLAERGVIPDFHLDMDPRENKAMTSLPPVPGVTYLVASVCAPCYFDALVEANAQIILWHTVSANWETDLQWVAEHDPGQMVVSTGSTIGLGAIQLGGILGYRRLEIHGMDGSFAGAARHAGPHAGKRQKPHITWDVNRVTYWTSKIMANAVAETINTAKNFPIITIWHGDGLTQALIRKSNLDNACCADQTEKVARLRKITPRVIPLPHLPKKAQSPWDGFILRLDPKDLPDLLLAIPRCEARRVGAYYNTGSIGLETAMLLRALCRVYQPQVIAEIGTFIGTSTEAMLARVIYTCDASNDCFPLSESVITHPKQSSTQMLAEIQEPVDLFFFDGRVQMADLPHLERLTHERTVFAFDDCIEGPTGKGLANMAILRDLFLPGRVFIPPYQAWKGRSTLGAWVPA